MREFLKGLDLDKELIDTIMVEHGKHLTGLKENNEELKKKVEEHEKTINELNGTISEKDKSLENLQSLTNENKDLKAELKMSGSGIKKEFSEFVKSKIMESVNDETDFEKALDNYKKDNPQFFGDTVVKKVQSSPNLNGGESQPQTTSSIMNDLIRGSRN